MARFFSPPALPLSSGPRRIEPTACTFQSPASADRVRSKWPDSIRKGAASSKDRRPSTPTDPEPLTYVERALAPTSDLLSSNAASTADAVKALIDRGASVIVLTETGTLPPDTSAALVSWIENGGTLVRFASPNLAATTVDELL